jgi:hypothetical protein
MNLLNQSELRKVVTRGGRGHNNGTNFHILYNSEVNRICFFIFIFVNIRQ